ncbi:MAG: hypothetical protein VYE77_11495 [Planctomycetota bacterium]|nr:hypothetical protein [Planctomycetota bacterium]
MSNAFRPIGGQDPDGGAEAPASGSGFIDWLADVAQRPGVVETLVAGLLVVTAVVVWLRLCRVVDNVRSRGAIEDYLLGVEQALSGDLPGARKRLERVLQTDPENHYARMLYGKVLSGSGEAAQAHKHHVLLQKSFAIDSVENDLHLARALEAVGKPAEAGDAVERAVRSDPSHEVAVEFLFRMRLQAGDHESAAKIGRRLLALTEKVEQELRDDIAQAVAEVGQQQLRAGNLGGAKAALTEAQRLSEAAPEVRLLQARVETAREGAAAVTEALLQDVGMAGQRVLPAPPKQASLLPTETVRAVLPALAPLLPKGRWRCLACGGGLSGDVQRCPRCGAEGQARVDEPALFEAVPTPGFLIDAMEQNRAHVRRMVDAALQAEEADDRERAADAVLELGDKAVADLLSRACGRHEATANAAIELLRRLGPSTTPALLAAAEEFEDQRLLPIGGSQIATVTGRVLQGFDREALVHVETLFASARSSSRKILIDYFLGLGDPEAFQVVLERFPPLEILHRLNKIEEPVLRSFLQSIPPGHFVAEALLLEEAFYRQEVILEAIPGARHPEVLEQVIVRRGPSQSLSEALLVAVGSTELRPVALRVLREFGSEVLDQVVAAFVDQDQDPEVREHLARLLTGFGPAAVARLCRSFGPEPTALDDDLRQVLVGLTDEAVPALEEAYARTDWLHTVTAGLVRRGNHRRAQIILVLGSLGTARAQSALGRLRTAESDPDLKLRLQQALHRLDEAQLAGQAGRADDADDAGEDDETSERFAEGVPSEDSAAGEGGGGQLAGDDDQSGGGPHG